MFTGLVAAKGTVRSIEGRAAEADGVRMAISVPLAGELERGDSVAVNGVCLTAVDARADSFVADVMPETLRRSSLAPLAEGDHVNVELPLRAGDRLGGHVVQGHVDGIGVVESVEKEGLARVLRVSAPPEILRYVVEKGSIAVDGVSLTVIETDDDGFAVSLVPETLERTTLGDASPGRAVNVEVDVLAKYVEKLAVRV